MLNLGRETNVTWNYINKGRLLNIFKYVGISDVTVFSAYSRLFGNLFKNISEIYMCFT